VNIFVHRSFDVQACVYVCDFVLKRLLKENGPRILKSAGMPITNIIYTSAKKVVFVAVRQ